MIHNTQKTYILAIESSCDDTAAAVSCNRMLLSNVVANQKIHEQYGGVVPELASRAHQQNIIPVVHEALKQAGINKSQLDAIAFTRGPGLMGSLLVGASFAKGLALSLNIPLIDVNHLQAHVMANFIEEKESTNDHPSFPFLCLLVSGGNSQIILVKSANDMEIIGKTIDDAAGEAFDKCAKIMGLPYPGGPHIDNLAKQGNALAFRLSKASIEGYDYSFSGLKTSFLYLLRDALKQNEGFIAANQADLCASLQHTIIETLMHKFKQAVADYGVKDIALAGGVSANSGLRSAFEKFGLENNKAVFIPKLAFTMDNAAMIAVTGYYKYLDNNFCNLALAPYARVSL